MKEEHEVASWEGFLRKLKKLQTAKRTLLFRGHGDAAWPLETTLERRGREEMSINDYYRLMATRVRPQVESFTGRRFDAPDYVRLRPLFNKYDEFSIHGFPSEVRSYLIHARHHGFPSPFLDWTRSPYVAAFFAFATENAGVKRRAIYAWSRPMFRSGGADQPEIKLIGQFVRTHHRHALQQSEYSYRATFHTEKGEWRFTPHEDGFLGTGIAAERLVKITIPSRERAKVLRFLDEFNLNAYSLFGSEESLMETIAVREFDLPAANRKGRGRKGTSAPAGKPNG